MNLKLRLMALMSCIILCRTKTGRSIFSFPSPSWGGGGAAGTGWWRSWRSASKLNSDPCGTPTCWRWRFRWKATKTQVSKSKSHIWKMCCNASKAWKESELTGLISDHKHDSWPLFSFIFNTNDIRYVRTTARRNKKQTVVVQQANSSQTLQSFSFTTRKLLKLHGLLPVWGVFHFTEHILLKQWCLGVLIPSGWHSQ